LEHKSKPQNKPDDKKGQKSEPQVEWVGQQLQSSDFANAFVQEIPRKEVTLFI